jgi:hypothetical protein
LSLLRSFYFSCEQVAVANSEEVPVKTATLTLTESFMLDAGVSAATLARLTGVAPTSLRDALRGESYLGAEKEARILKTVSLVAKFKQALEPLDLPKEWADLDVLIKSGKTPKEVEALVKQIFNQ